jgi:hypothetical protein
MRLARCLLLASVSLLGCSSEDEESRKRDPNEDPPTPMVGVEGVTIHEVAVYQGVKRTLAQGGQALTSNVPLVAGRDALVRISYTATPEAVGRTVTGRLDLAGGDPIDVSVQLVPQSNDADYASTADIIVPGTRIGSSFEYSASIVEPQVDGADDNPTAHHPAVGREVHPVEGPANTFRVVLAPFRYDADGSGRLPDLSPERIEAYRVRLMQLYPVSNVEVTVREPTPWSQQILPNGMGWQEVGIATYGFRGQDGAAEDVYYYGIFNPASSFSQFCLGGCLLGVTLLNSDPPDVGNPQLRLALGVGFDEVGTDTAAHELGHSHGRPHAPCSSFGPLPDGLDPEYPHAGGVIGVWGWDIFHHQLVDPNAATDIMSYCENQWISDHNFARLLARAKNVNLPKLGADTGRHLPHELVVVDGLGNADWRETTQSDLGAGSVDVAVTLETGEVERVRGHYYAYDHLPGGWLLFPSPASRAVRVEADVAGRSFAVSR